MVADPRTLLANERTVLAWLRTSASLITLGFGVAKLGQWLHQAGRERGISVAELLGGAFILLGAAAALLALARFRKVSNALAADAPVPLAGAAISIIVGVVALIGLFLGVYVLLLRHVS